MARTLKLGSIGLRTRDLPGIVRQIQSLDGIVQLFGRQATRKFHNNVRARTEQTAPVDTGFMSENVESKFSSDGQTAETGWYRNTFTAGAERGRFYPHYQEYGTSRHAAQPSLGPAFYEFVGDYQANLARLIASGIARMKARGG